MQKKILVLAIAAAVSAPAFADTTVTVYGQGHVSVDHATTYDATGTSVSKLNMSSNSSRLGVSAASTFDNGMTGFAKIEDGISFVNGDAAHTGLAHRAAIIGMKGDFGSVEFGYQDSLFKGTFAKFDVMFNSIGDSRNILDKGDFDVRSQNGIYYTSPNMSGFQLGVGYSTSYKNALIATQNNNDGSLTDVVLTYSNDGYFVTVGNEQLNNVNATTGVKEQKISGTRLVAGYKTGPMDIRAIYQHATNSGTLYDASLDRNVYGAAFVYNIGGSVILQYMKAGASAATGGADGASQITVGYSYPLAKNSNVYVMYDSVSNDTNANYGIGNGHDLAYANDAGFPGKNVSAVSAGYIYKF
jgi:predicted porin